MDSFVRRVQRYNRKIANTWCVVDENSKIRKLSDFILFKYHTVSVSEYYKSGFIGVTEWDPKKSKVRIRYNIIKGLNNELAFNEYKEVVIHEIAHFITYRLFNTTSHNHQFKMVCNVLGNRKAAERYASTAFLQMVSDL